MDAFLAIASLRVVREYSQRPIPDESLDRILNAGRAAGSSRNTQPWRFYVVTGRERLSRLAEAVYAPANVLGAQAAIALGGSGKGDFDLGRLAQNMMLAAWDEGIGSAPNGIKDPEILESVIPVREGDAIRTVLSLGFPARPHRPSEDDVDGILRRIDRKPLDELVVRIDGD